jgi:TolB-like protein/DNA-binding winged helix-turn-helix (wHTH) protein
MQQASQPERVVRFGAFELNLHSGELRKQGVKVKLQEQPFQVLAILLENPGKVVAREELRQRLWPQDTFVDFEHSLATDINKIREALNDTVQTPHFIETVPRRGYRFIAQIALVSPAADPLATPPSARGDGHVAAADVGASLIPDQSERPWSSLRARRVIAAVIGALVIISGLVIAFDVGGLREHLASARGTGSGALATNIQSIAVLPIENLSHDPEQEYFADGVTDALITDLGKISALRVISRQSVMRYKGSKKPLPDIARELNVDALVEGAVVHSGNRVRITAQLVRGQPERQLWAESYESDLQDVLVLQGEVARAIADEIKVNVEPQERARLSKALPLNPEAHDAYLEGLLFYYRETRRDLPKAIQYTQRAIQLEPNYAPAYALLAACFYDSSEWRLGDVPNAEAAQKAVATALKALQLDDSLAEPHVVLAAIHDSVADTRHRSWDWLGAERELRRAIELDPNLVTAHVGLAWHFVFMKRDAEAIQEVNRAVELDPVSTYTLSHEIYILYITRHYDQAIEQAHRLLEVYPGESDPKWTYSVLARCFEAKGMYDDEVAMWKKKLTLQGNAKGAASLEHAYKNAGIKGVWLWQLGKANEDVARGKAAEDEEPGDVPGLYSLLGEKDRALEWLEKQYLTPGQFMAFVRVEPVFDNLHSDPRYQDLIRRMNFPPSESGTNEAASSPPQ